MPSRRPLLPLIALSAALSACQAAPGPAPAASAPAPFTPDAQPPVHAQPAATLQAPLCQPEAAAPWLGQALQADTAERVRAATGAQRVRVIHPGQAITKDLRRDRINLQIDSQGRLQRVYCG